MLDQRPFGTGAGGPFVKRNDETPVGFDVEIEADEHERDWGIPAAVIRVLLNRVVDETEQECIKVICARCASDEPVARGPRAHWIHPDEMWGHGPYYCDASLIHERRRKRENQNV
jgi:hypothetical protein